MRKHRRPNKEGRVGLSERLEWIERWLQKEDDERRYPNGDVMVVSDGGDVDSTPQVTGEEICARVEASCFPLPYRSAQAFLENLEKVKGLAARGLGAGIRYEVRMTAHLDFSGYNIALFT